MFKFKVVAREDEAYVTFFIEIQAGNKIAAQEMVTWLIGREIISIERVETENHLTTEISFKEWEQQFREKKERNAGQFGNPRTIQELTKLAWTPQLS